MDDFLCEMKERVDYAADWWRDNFDHAREDVKFLLGKQWPDEAVKERAAKGRPCLTFNRLPSFVDQIVGDQRQNRPQCNIIAANDNDPVIFSEAGQQYKTSQVYSGLIKNIEYNSNADAHYDRAFQHAVESGFGWLRVITDYCDATAFEQEIKIASISNRFAVLIDPDALEPDFSDANYCFVIEKMRCKEFRKKYPNKMQGNFLDRDMNDEDFVQVAEYFWREKGKRTLVLLSNGKSCWKDEIESVIEELSAEGVFIEREREVDHYKVYWNKVTSQDILEKKKQWPGSIIPIIPVLGKCDTDEGKSLYRGAIRHGKDAQLMHNYQMSAGVEKVGMSAKAQWVASAESIEGYEDEWDNANIENRSVLRFNGMLDAPPPQRVMGAPVPQAELQLAMVAAEEIKATIGIYDASLGAQSADRSGRAIVARQQQADRGTFTYVDNLSYSIHKLGKIMVEIIPIIYDSERVIRVRFPDGTTDWVKINQTVIDEQTGNQVIINDIGMGKFDVVAKAGPSYATKRLETVDSLLGLVNSVPRVGEVAADIIAQNMDWVGSDVLAKRLAKMIPPNLLTEKEMIDNEIPPPQPNPEQDAEVQKTMAEVQKIQADSQLALAKIEEIAANIQKETRDEKAFIRETVAEAIAELMNGR